MTAEIPILIAGDDPDVRRSFCDILARAGFVVQDVPCGQEVVERVRRERYGTILVDHALPDLDGHAITQLAREADPQVPVIVVIGQAGLDSRIRVMHDGAFAYITKPVPPEELVATVRRAVTVRTLTERTEHVEQALRESEERFGSLVESAPDAIIVTDEEGKILSWNRSAQRLFGYDAGEALGRSLTMLIPPEYREAHQRGIARLAAAGRGKLIGRTVELQGLKRDGTVFPLELSLSMWQTTRGRFFGGIIRDVTERKRVEQRLRAQHATAQVLAQAPSLREAAPGILEAICECLDWDLGALWEVHRESQALHPVYFWSNDPIGLADFIALSRAMTYAPGIGLPGRVWPDRRPHWITNVLQDANFPREDIAAKVGLHGAAAFPILLGGEVLGVIEVLSRESRTPDEPMLAMMATIGAQLGQFVQRKRAEEALRDSEERFRQVTENIREVFWMTNPEKTEMIYISPGYEEIWGRTCDSLYACPGSWLDVIHPDDRPRVLEAALTKQVTGEYAEQYRIVRPDGEIRWIHDQAFPIRGPSGTVFRIAGVAADVTERTLATEGLEQAHRRMDSILSDLPAAVLLLDDRLDVVFANPPACQYFAGGKPCVGLPLHDLIPLEQAAWERVIADIWAMGAPDPPRYEENVFALHGRTYRYRVFAVPAGGGGRQAGLVAWDMTEQERLQDQLIQAEKLASLGTLVSGMAHEVNNPVQGILGMAEIIREETDPDRIREYAQDIVQYSLHIAAVVRNFSAYARPAARDGETALDLVERLREAVKMVQRGPYCEHVEVALHADALPGIRARQTEIDQIFVNLISNAAQAMNGRGRLTIRAWTQDHATLVSIADTGCGIPKGLQSKIFDPFFSTKDPGQGTGLGLSIAQRLLTKYGGAITVESEEGRGTTFTLRFPPSMP